MDSEQKRAIKIIAAREHYHLRKWTREEFVEVYYEIKSFLKVKNKAAV